MNPSKKIIALVSMAEGIKKILNNHPGHALPYTIERTFEKLRAACDEICNVHYKGISITVRDINEMYNKFCVLYEGLDLNVLTLCSYIIDSLTDVLTHIKNVERRNAIAAVQSHIQKIANFYDPRGQKEMDYVQGMVLAEQFNRIFA